MGVSKGFPFCVFGFFDFVWSAVADEDGFAAPFDDYLCDLLCQWLSMEIGLGNRGGKVYVFAFWYSGQVNLDFGLCEHVRRGGHVD